MAATNMTISEQILLEKCREIEFLCKELYEYFAVIHADNVDAARLWNKTTIEEQNHADQFTLLLKLRKGLNCQVSVDPERIDKIIDTLKVVIARSKEQPPTFADALNSAIHLEKYLAEFHLSCVVVFEEISFKKMFDAMMLSDQEHIGSLQAAFDELENSRKSAVTC